MQSQVSCGFKLKDLGCTRLRVCGCGAIRLEDEVFMPERNTQALQRIGFQGSEVGGSGIRCSLEARRSCGETPALSDCEPSEKHLKCCAPMFRNDVAHALKIDMKVVRRSCWVNLLACKKNQLNVRRIRDRHMKTLCNDSVIGSNTHSCNQVRILKFQTTPMFSRSASNSGTKRAGLRRSWETWKTQQTVFSF